MRACTKGGIMNALADTYFIRPFQFAEKIEALHSFEDICLAISDELSWFGFKFVTSFLMPGPGEKFKSGIHFNTRPQEYIDRYETENYVDKDPVVTELRHCTSPFSWTDVKSKRRLKRSEKRIIDEASEFGANDGLIIPILTLTGSISLFCPCGENPDLSPRARRAVELICLYAHEAIKRKLIEIQRDNTPHIPLTPREREVMKWVAAGKSDYEIGEILSISSGTVKIHVENAKRKLDAFRRTFAIVKAIRCGEINI